MGAPIQLGARALAPFSLWETSPCPDYNDLLVSDKVYKNANDPINDSYIGSSLVTNHKSPLYTSSL